MNRFVYKQQPRYLPSDGMYVKPLAQRNRKNLLWKVAGMTFVIIKWGLFGAYAVASLAVLTYVACKVLKVSFIPF